MEAVKEQKIFTKEYTNIVKGFAIIMLLLYHLFGNVYELGAMGVICEPLSYEVFSVICGFGNICVSIFVFLTAYGISKSIDIRSDIDGKLLCGQAFKRAGRLMVQFFLLYLSVVLVMHPHLNFKAYYGEGGGGFVQMLVDSLGLSHFFSTKMMNITWWYMEIAYLLIFLVPFLCVLYKKTGIYLILVMYVFPFLIPINGDVLRYLLVAVAGVCAAYGGWIEKAMNGKLPLVLKWLIGILGLALCVYVREKRIIQDGFLNLADPVIVVFITCTISVTIGSVPVVRTIFAFLGRHSMNIFLVHTFFYLLIWRAEIYQFKYAIVTFLLLLSVSLLYSVCLEAVKKLGKWVYKKAKGAITSTKK